MEALKLTFAGTACLIFLLWLLALLGGLAFWGRKIRRIEEAEKNSKGGDHGNSVPGRRRERIPEE